MEDTHQEPEAPLTPVALFDEERQRRVGRGKGRPRPRASQPPAPASEDDGYGWTLDLADTVNLPDEHGGPTADELLARYESLQPAAASSADAEEQTVRDSSPKADEILLAISSHHERTEPPGPTQAPRGSADLRPAAPRTRRRVYAARRATAGRPGAHLRSAISARGHRWSSAISSTSLRRASRVRVLTAVGLASTALVGLAVSLRYSPSAPSRTPPATQADTAHAPLIGAGTLALLIGQIHGGSSPLGWKLPAAATTKLPVRHKVKPARHTVQSGRHKVKSGQPRTKVAAHRTGTTAAGALSPSQGSSTAAESSSATGQSSSTDVVSHAPSYTQSSQTTPGSDRGSAGSRSSAGCRGAGVMAPTNCGKPSL